MKIPLYILFILLSLQLQAQVSLENLSLKDTKVKEMYRYHLNDLKIVSIDTNALYKLKAKFSEVKPSPISNTEFLVYSKYLGIDTLEIIKNGKVIKTEYFEVKKTPEPNAWICFPSRNELSVQQIILNPRIYCYEPTINLKIKTVVTSFMIIILDSQGNKVFSGNNISDKINRDALTIIKSLKRGSQVLLEDIRCVGSEVCPRKLKPLNIKII